MKNECKIRISSMKYRKIYLVAIFQARVCSLWEAVGRSVLESCSRILNNLRYLEFVYFMPLLHTPQFTVTWICVFYATLAYSTIYGVLNLCILEFCHSRILHNYGILNLCTLKFSWRKKYKFWWAALPALSTNGTF